MIYLFLGQGLVSVLVSVFEFKFEFCDIVESVEFFLCIVVIIFVGC